MKRYILFSIVLVAVLSCTQQEYPSSLQESEYSDSVICVAPDFVSEGKDDAKTNITQTDVATVFSWKTGDVIGVIPTNDKTVQSNFEIQEIGEDSKQALFDGGKWALKEGRTYIAYYPYQVAACTSRDTLACIFSGQCQTANNSSEHIGSYDYMYARAVEPEKGKATFSFNHLICLVKLQLTVPATDIYKSARLESDSALFASKASLKLSDGTMIGSDFLRYYTLNLSEVKVSSGDVLTVWIAMLPTSNIKGKTLGIKLYGATTYASGSISIADEFKAGCAYSYSCSPAKSDAPEYVDLGLSVKWASWNVGATKPEDYGGYYQWAGLEDVTSTSIYLSSSNCPYHTGSSSATGWTKYIPSDKSSYWSGAGSPDKKPVLDPEDDVAHVKLGDKWRMPIDAEWTELIDNCTWTWIDDYYGTGISGRIVTSNKPGYTDKSIFLPAAGYRSGGSLSGVGSGGYYWSSSLDTDYPSYAYSDRSSALRLHGQSVRAVYGDIVFYPEEIILEKTLTIKQHNFKTLVASVIPSEALYQTIVWSSSDTSIATVDENGGVYGEAPGTATITATTAVYGGVSASCEVTITANNNKKEISWAGDSAGKKVVTLEGPDGADYKGFPYANSSVAGSVTAILDGKDGDVLVEAATYNVEKTYKVWNDKTKSEYNLLRIGANTLKSGSMYYTPANIYQIRMKYGYVVIPAIEGFRLNHVFAKFANGADAPVFSICSDMATATPTTVEGISKKPVSKLTDADFELKRTKPNTEYYMYIDGDRLITEFNFIYAEFDQ